MSSSACGPVLRLPGVAAVGAEGPLEGGPVRSPGGLRPLLLVEGKPAAHVPCRSETPGLRLCLAAPGALVERLKAEKPRSWTSQNFERNPGPSRAGRASLAVRGEGPGGAGGSAARRGCGATRALCRREELPTIYKCPHQGCTAVYRGADGMKVRGAAGGAGRGGASGGRSPGRALRPRPRRST